MKKTIFIIFIFCCAFIIKSTNVLADDLTIPEFQTQATVINTTGAKAYTTDGDISNVTLAETIPYNAVVYGDSVSSAPLAITITLSGEDDMTDQELSFYRIKYNDNIYYVSTGDVSQFKLMDDDVTENQEPVTTPDTNNDTTQENSNTNPTTGEAGIIVAWIVAASALLFSFFYFIRYTKVTNI